MARWTSRLTTVRVEDSLGAGITLGPGVGDLSIGGENPENAEHIKKLDRGVHDGFVIGDDIVQDVSITLELRNETLTEAAIARVMDFAKKQGSFATASSVDPTVWAFKMIVTMTDNINTGIRTLPIVEGEWSFSEAKEGHTWSFAGRNHGPIVES